jgi:hypothetical protein
MENQINRILAGQLSVLEDEELEKELELIMKDIEIPTLPNIPIISEKIPVISEKIPVISEKIPIISENIPIISEKMDYNELISDDNLLQELNEIVDISKDNSVNITFPEVPTSIVLPTPPNDEILIKEKVENKRKLVSS